MGNIQDLLAQILSARYGRDVRQSIHDAIETCYEDGHAGAIDLQAREDIAQTNELLGNTDISEISETVTGAVVELNGAVGTAQTTADGAVTAAQDAQSTANQAVNGLDTKQDTILYKTSFTGDIDAIDEISLAFCMASSVSGTKPWNTGYFLLETFKASSNISFLQKAYQFNNAGITTVAYRMWANSKWYPWKYITLS